MTAQEKLEEQNRRLREALRLIKLHIGDDSADYCLAPTWVDSQPVLKSAQYLECPANARPHDLHLAVQLIVTVAREHGLLLEHGGR